MMMRSRHRPKPGAAPSSYDLGKAEYLLERDYEKLKGPTLRALRAKLRSRRMHFDSADMEGFYNQAWHALYTKVQGGEKVEQIPGFLVQVAFFRAVDEYRRLHVADHADAEFVSAEGLEGITTGEDVDALLDDSRALREVREGMEDRLTPSEAAAATLCYFHGYSRAEAAEALGVNDRQIQRLMDAASKKIGTIVDEIKAGAWCKSRESLIKAYALGILDPEGERHRMASAHLAECSACRRYVLALRGLAAATPPALLPIALASAGVLGGGGAAVGGAVAGKGTAAGTKAGAAGGKQAGRGVRTAGAVAAAVAVVAIAAGGVIAATGGFQDDPPAKRASAGGAGGSGGAGAGGGAGGAGGSASSSGASGLPATPAKPRVAPKPKREKAERKRKPARKAAPPAVVPVVAPVPPPVATPEPVAAPEPAEKPKPAPPRTDGRQEFGVEAAPGDREKPGDKPKTPDKPTPAPKPDPPDEPAAPDRSNVPATTVPDAQPTEPDTSAPAPAVP